MHDPSLPETPLEGPATLSNCDREPIHIPATIQHFGCLVVVDKESLRIVSVSENSPDFLSRSAEDLVGEPGNEAFGEFDSVVKELSDKDEGTIVNRSVCLDGKRNQWLSAHWCGDNYLLEFESVVENEFEVSIPSLLGNLFLEMDRKPIEQVYDSIIREIRNFCDFDRVMLYQFHEDAHGSVIAEAKCDDQEPFLGLHYPAGDIPVPARRLYELKWIRTIADVHANPVPMHPAIPEASGRPINMSFASLRSTSPIHCEYLRNMQVGASMSISVMNGDKLWGLIACHHNSPKVVPADVRDACELAGSLLSTFLSSRHQQQYLKRQVEIGDVIAQQMSVLASYDDVAQGLERAAPALAETMTACGLAWREASHHFSWGEVPNENEIDQIVQQLVGQSPQPVAYSSRLGKWVKSAQKYQDRIAGVLAVRVGAEQQGILLFFRPPLMSTIHWAGDPNKSTTDESGRLTPRKSFAQFEESVTGESAPWTVADRHVAAVLSDSLKNMIVEQSERLQRANRELRQLNTDLDAFAYAASHDLREPLRGIHHYSYLLEQATDLSDESFKRNLEGMKNIIRRMNDLLSGLLRFSRAGRQDLQYESFLLSETVTQAKDLLFDVEKPIMEGDVEEEIELEVDGTIRGDFACVREILSNLISNALKYNTNDPKQIKIGLMPAIEAPLRHSYSPGTKAIYIRDNGIGIAETYQSQVFDIFRRLHGREEFGGGSGAGLTIVRRMVERHEGEIAIKSRPDAGTTFYFTLERGQK